MAFRRQAEDIHPMEELRTQNLKRVEGVWSKWSVTNLGGG